MNKNFKPWNNERIIHLFNFVEEKKKQHYYFSLYLFLLNHYLYFLKYNIHVTAVTIAMIDRAIF